MISSWNMGEVENIARICWETNRALQVRDMEELPEPPWDAAPHTRKKALMFLVTQVLEGAVLSPEEAHNCWWGYLADKRWEYARVKDFGERKHPSLRPWAELTPREQLAQRLNMHIIHEIVNSETPATIQE